MPGFLRAVSHEELPTFEEGLVGWRGGSKRKSPSEAFQQRSQELLQAGFHDPEVCGEWSMLFSCSIAGSIQGKEGGHHSCWFSYPEEVLPLF